jgi:ParB family chromosome partitioning protein
LSSRRRLSNSLTDAFAGAATHGFGGASALFDNVPGTGHLRRIPIDRIRPRDERPRRSLNPDALDELSASIRAHGVLQPIRVRSAGSGRYEIIAGERRWIAARQAGLREIPALIAASDDQHAYVESLVENVQREDLNAVDRANALRHLRVNLGLQSWEDVGRVVGITRQHVHNLLRVTQLPESIQDDVRAGELTEKHARALLLLRDDPETQSDLWEQMHSDELSGDAALEIAQSIRAAPSATARREVRSRSAAAEVAHAADEACVDDEWHRESLRPPGDSARVSRDATLNRAGHREHDARGVQPDGAHRIGTAVDNLLTVLAASTPDEVAAARGRLDELQLRLRGLLARAGEPGAPPAIRPVAGPADAAYAGAETWQPVLLPAAGHPAG